MKKTIFVAVALASSMLVSCDSEKMTGTSSPTFEGNSTSEENENQASTTPSCTNQFSFFDEVFRLTNNERQKFGLDPVMLAKELIQTAQSHSEDMAENNYFSHTGLNGSTPGERAVGFGYNRYVYENIGAGYATPEEVVEGWMNSQGHRENILNASHTEVGTGFATSTTSQYDTYWTLLYGNRLEDQRTPTPSSAIPENLIGSCTKIEPDQAGAVKAWTPESDLIAGLSVNPYYKQSAVSTPEPAMLTSLFFAGIGLLALGQNRSNRRP